MLKIRRLASGNQSIKAFTLTAVVWIVLLSTAQQALAHHAIGGRIPSNFFEGFLSGLAHPVIGLDHFAFVIAIGLVAAGQINGALILAAFVLTALAGTGIHLLSFNLPATEIAIAVSVIAFGAMLMLPKRLNIVFIVVLAAIAGLFHGYAYGEAIIGAQMSPLVAYLLGFSLIQYVVALVAQAIGNIVIRKTANKPSQLLRFTGLSLCAIGVVFLTNTIGN